MEMVTQQTKNNQSTALDIAMISLFDKLDSSIEDIENGRIQTLDEAWQEIDAL